MKILQLISSSGFFGAENVLVQLANELNLGGYSLACYLPLSQSREESQGRQQPCQKPVTEEIRYAH